MSGTSLEVPTIVSGVQPATPTPAESSASAAPIDQPTILHQGGAPVVEPVAEPTPTPEPEKPAEPVAQPVVEGEAKPVESEVKPVEGEVKPTEEKPAEAKPPSHTDKPTLLETEDTKAEDKPAEGEKPQTAEVAKYEPFTFPDGVEADEPTLAKFTEILGGPSRLDQATAQKLVDLHGETIGALRAHLEAEQYRVFGEMRQGWLNQTMADPVLGGAGHKTALQAAARMRDLLVAPEHRAEFADFMRITGAGDHPALFRLLHNAARLFDEPAPPQIPGRPIPDRGGNARQSRGEMMYDHPSSRRAVGR